MAFYKTKGIIIKRDPSGEADCVITVFTKEHGKLRLAGRGMRRITSKLASELDLFNYTDFLITSGRSFDVITGALTIQRFPFLKQDLKRLQIAEYLTGLLDCLSAEGHQDKEIFSLLKRIFVFLDKEKRAFDPWLILRNFEWELLTKSGFKPKLYECSSCHKKLKPERNYLSSKGQGIICSSCQKRDPYARDISNNSIKILRLLESRDFQKLQKLALLSKQKQELKNTLQYFLENI